MIGLLLAAASKGKGKKMSKHSKSENGKAEIIGLVVAALLAVWFYFRNGSTFTVPGNNSALSGASHVTYYQPDPKTGCPVYSSNDVLSIPPGAGIPVLTDPGSGAILGAPAGYTLWLDQATNSYAYFPNAVIG